MQSISSKTEGPIINDKKLKIPDLRRKNFNILYKTKRFLPSYFLHVLDYLQQRSVDLINILDNIILHYENFHF